MAKDLNKVLLIGRLGDDPEMKYTQSGIAFAKFSLATSAQWKDQEGNNQDKTEWHNVIAWRRLAEICSEYLKKGSKIYIEGSLSTSSWEDENKKRHYKTEIVMSDMIMLDSKGGTGFNADSGNSKPKKQEQDIPEVKEDDEDLPF